MKTFCLQTLGCKVNQYETEQVAALLRSRGLIETTPDQAELRIINSCSVTVQAASQSRQATRRMTRLPVISDASPAPKSSLGHPSEQSHDSQSARPRVLVMGCWATSDRPSAASLPGVDAVLTHQDDLSAELDRLLAAWGLSRHLECANEDLPHAFTFNRPPEATNEFGWMIKAGSGAGESTSGNKAKSALLVNENSQLRYASNPRGANSLPLLGESQSARRRAFLKIQDGCDAHCTYCIIPKLRPTLFSKPPGEVVEEAQRLVEAGHVEIVLTGIFLGAYGQPTALRHRQAGGRSPLAYLVERICTEVRGLKRLRISSIEPGDLSDDLLATLISHEQIAPHFHIPLQSGCDRLLRRMNRQYRRDDFLRMVERVNSAFNRPALTTDIIVGFPGEGDAEFDQTVEVALRAGFIHIHAFPYSPRPGTAAARWQTDFIRGPVVNDRERVLQQLAQEQCLRFRTHLIGQIAEVIVERGEQIIDGNAMVHGRSERYFPVHLNAADVTPGELVRVRIDRATDPHTFGSRVQS